MGFVREMRIKRAKMAVFGCRMSIFTRFGRKLRNNAAFGRSFWQQGSSCSELRPIHLKLIDLQPQRFNFIGLRASAAKLYPVGLRPETHYSRPSVAKAERRNCGLRPQFNRKLEEMEHI